MKKVHLGVIIAGAAVGLAALILTALGNPTNMGFCIACFLRDISGARLELLARNAHDERAEHEANDLRADILHLCRAVQAHRAGNIAQKARDAEAHVRGVAEHR